MATPSQKLQMVQVDVFTNQALMGNALAVCLDGRGLETDQMQAIARETNLSETTFILPRDQATEREHGKRVRIFTVAEELPFAGHPTLGTAFVLRGSSRVPEIRLELNVGLVPVRFEEADGEPAFGEMTQIEPEFGGQHDREAVVKAIGLGIEDLDPELPVETVSTGLPYTITPIRSLTVLRGLRIDPSRRHIFPTVAGNSSISFAGKPSIPRLGCMLACFFMVAKIRLRVRRQDVRRRGW